MRPAVIGNEACLIDTIDIALNKRWLSDPQYGGKRFHRIEI